MVVPLDIRAILGTLAQHDVEYVLVGSLAAIAHGARLHTEDVDICNATGDANLQRIAAALVELDARLIREPPRGTAAIDMHDWRTLRLGDPAEHHLFATRYGEIDVLPEPLGPGGWGTSSSYATLNPDATTITVFGLPLRVAAYATVMASKLAAGRPQDIAAEAELRRAAGRLAAGITPDYGLEEFAAELQAA